MSDNDVIVVDGCANAYTERHGFLTPHSDGERRADAIGPEAEEWLQQATTGDSCARPARSAGRHEQAVSDILGDLHGGVSTRREK